MAEIKANPGQYHFDNSEITINADRQSKKITMKNTGDRPVQIGSHYHLYEVNDAIIFYDQNKNEDKDRKIAWGYRFDIPSSTSVRFEPGESKEVDIIPMAGTREVYGMSNLCDGKLDNGPKEPYTKVIADRKAARKDINVHPGYSKN